jgi:opacity protein-like surface antigen
MMSKFLFAATAISILAAPALAADQGFGYVGVEGGVLFPHSQDVFGLVTYTNTTIGPIPRAQAGGKRYRPGYDVDLIGGYDFGVFRLEGELGYKQAKAKPLTFGQAFITSLNTNAGTAYTTSTAFDLRNRTTALSAMVNGLVNLGGHGGLGGYAGAGVGYANVEQLTGSKGRLAWQFIAGIRAPLSSNIEVGVKYRFFNAERNRRPAIYAFTAGTAPCGAGRDPLPCTGGVAVFDDTSRFNSHSLLLSVIYQFVPAAALGTVGLATGQFHTSPEFVGRDARNLPIDLGPGYEKGRKLVMVNCAECHGPAIQGTELEPGLTAPDLAVAAGYDLPQFTRFMRPRKTLGFETPAERFEACVAMID